MALSANDMAIKLIALYRNNKEKNRGIYRLSKEAFKTIAGKTSLRDSYLWDVDASLREDGYMTLDMRSEKNQIAITSMATIIKNFQEISDELVNKNAYPPDDIDTW